jgi:predicted nicotinamide N-methyase
MVVIELGSGPGLAGLLAAKMGARVIITDKGVVVPLINENITLNGISSQPSSACPGSAMVGRVHLLQPDGATGYREQLSQGHCPEHPVGMPML